MTTLIILVVVVVVAIVILFILKGAIAHKPALTSQGGYTEPEKPNNTGDASVGGETSPAVKKLRRNI